MGLPEGALTLLDTPTHNEAHITVAQIDLDNLLNKE